MKAKILDVEALRAISPMALSAFARSEGWSRTESYGAHADVYAGPDHPEVILPRTDQLADYASVLSRLIGVFAAHTGRDELATYRDLVGADRDVVRVRAVGTSDDGSIPLDAGVRIIEKARDMLLAAACAVNAPQSIYRAGANRQALEYMSRVKLGQTEHGSFVVTMLAPVPPSLPPAQAPLSADWLTLDEEPVERQVTRRLMTALRASRTAAELALSGDSRAFEDAVSAGVSANLCDAVAGLIEQSQRLDISLTWARTRPIAERQSQVTFSRSDADILKEAARTFHMRAPRPDVKLYGTVHSLKRDQDDIDGVVTLKAIIDDKTRSVSAVLDPVNYSVAVQAHDAQTQVIVTGDLQRNGARWHLTNASVIPLPTDADTD